MYLVINMMVEIVYDIFIDKSRIYDFGLFALYTYIYSPNLSFQCTRAPNRFYHKIFFIDYRIVSWEKERNDYYHSFVRHVS